MEFGKFKDATSLYDAYKNLEKVFTKKCQELKILTKKLEEGEEAGEKALSLEDNNLEPKNFESKSFSKSVENLGEAIQNQPEEPYKEKEGVGNGLNLEENPLGASKNESEDDNKTSIDEESSESVASSLKSEFKDAVDVLDSNGLQCDVENVKKIETAPRFKSPEWRKDVAKFFTLVPEAKQFKGEIARFIMDSPALWAEKDVLSKAFQIVKNSRPASNEIKSGEEKLVGVDEKTSPALYSKKSLFKDMTIEEYFKQLLDRQGHLPKFVDSRKGSSSIGLTTPRKINSLTEARDFLLKNYFK